jgi:hypothetical protein
MFAKALDVDKPASVETLVNYHRQEEAHNKE